MELDDPVAAWAWNEWAKDSIESLANEKAERQRQRARRAYPQSPEDVAATTYKARVTDVWSAGAAAYGVAMHGSISGSRSGPLAPLTQAFVQLVGESLRDVAGFENPQQQLKVLDAASGPGEPAASIAGQWPTLCVFSADLAPGMTAAAQQRNWKGPCLPNLVVWGMDAEDTSMLPDSCISAVTCCHGLQYFAQYERALAEWHRILQDHRLLAVSVPKSGTLQSAQLAAAVRTAIAPDEQLVAPPASVGDVPSLLAAFGAAGFCSPQCKDVSVPLHIPADGVRAHLEADPFLAELLKRLEAGGRLDVMQAAEEAASAAAQQAGWLHEDGSIVMEDVHTVISVRNCAKPKRQKLQLPKFMAKKLEEYRAMMNTSEDGGAADAGGSGVAAS